MEGFEVYDTVLRYDEIRQRMSKSKCNNKMIFADACFSGRIRTNDKANEESLSDKETNVMLFLSSRSNELSSEISYMSNGFFTTYLQKALRGAADSDKNRIITAKELFDYVHPNVVKISKDRQHPVMWGNFSDYMPVIKW